jgi:hypothetical protein
LDRDDRDKPGHDALRAHLPRGGEFGGSPICIGSPTIMEITTRMATSTMRHLTTIRILAGMVVSRSTTYHRIMVAMAISAADTMSAMKFISVLLI